VPRRTAATAATPMSCWPRRAPTSWPADPPPRPSSTGSWTTSPAPDRAVPGAWSAGLRGVHGGSSAYVEFGSSGGSRGAKPPVREGWGGHPRRLVASRPHAPLPAGLPHGRVVRPRCAGARRPPARHRLGDPPVQAEPLEADRLRVRRRPGRDRVVAEPDPLL